MAGFRARSGSRWLALLVAIGAGCSDDAASRLPPAVDAPAADARTGDAPAGDAPVGDALATDAATPDAIAIDAAMPDAIAIDAAMPDAIAIDAAMPDAIAIDAAVPDAIAIDAAVPDAPATDAPATDAPATDAPAIDAAATDGTQCHILNLTAAQACAIAFTGRVTACAIDGSGTPSDTSSLEIRRPDGARGYLCSFNWTSTGGFYYGDRTHLRASAAQCCGGPTSATVGWPATHADYGVPHGPTRIGPQEMLVDNGGDLRHNPFSITISSAAAAATYPQARAQWQAWSGDGQPHPAPDGTGSYYFPAYLVVNYVLLATATGDPLIVIAPEPSLDPAHTRPLGHPTLGACPGQGGAPVAFIAGDLHGTTLTNGSGRFGFESTVTAAHLDAAARLFNCYGIPVHDVTYGAP